MSNPIEEISAAILHGKVDSHLEAIEAWVKTRKKSIALAQLASLREGSRVRLQNVRPKYLDGELATVKEVRGDQVAVRMDRQLGRFSQDLVASASQIEVLN